MNEFIYTEDRDQEAGQQHNSAVWQQWVLLPNLNGAI